jgi:hypothetical protein
MSHRDLVNNIKLVNLIKPIVVNNDSEGGSSTTDGVDTKGFDSVVLAALFGDSGDTLSGSVYFEVKLEHSDDNDTFTAVTESNYVLLPEGGIAAAPAAGGVIATIDAPAEDQVVVAVGYVGPKRYVRLFIDTTGTHTNGTPITTLALLGHPHLSPISY